MATMTISLITNQGTLSSSLTFADSDVARLLAAHKVLLDGGAGSNAQAAQLMVRRMLGKVLSDVRAYEADQAAKAVGNITYTGV